MCSIIYSPQSSWLLYTHFKKMLYCKELTFHTDMTYRCVWQAKWTWVNLQIFIAHLENAAGPNALEQTAGLAHGALIIRGFRLYHIMLPSLQLLKRFEALTLWYCHVIILHFLSLLLLCTRLIICKNTAAHKVILNPIQVSTSSHSLQHVRPTSVGYTPLGGMHKILLGH